MIFLDSNIPMYAVGAPHPLRDRSKRLVQDFGDRKEPLVTSAEVFQEILHRYHTLGRIELATDAFDFLHDVCGDVFEVTVDDVEAARRLLLPALPISARDALHLAVMNRCGVSRILTFDKGFDAVTWVERIF